jgi:3-isopropylmalate dehydratase small subunit
MAKVVYKLGNDVSTDTIYPGRFMATVLPSETPKLAFADDADFNGRLNRKEVPAGSVIVAGKNFGCGSSREQAASCLKGHALVVVAESFARIFLQNSVNLGLRTVTAPGVEASVGDELIFDGENVINQTTGKLFAIVPLSGTQQAVIDAGGLIAYSKKRLIESDASQL